ncbi:hypothetical protein [Nakamurella aerolata]|uniref:Uncharacterized protein n=1 Tax=Nakamurella aerolata TaxID=1656892 RepID=A0A849ACN8_9ACTN|nr:hypothetical protein [Nakamurella aerolata]NNG37493.1 hypothetical protein [Nakamurella aerolata]
MNKASLTVLLSVILVLCAGIVGASAYLIGRDRGTDSTVAAAQSIDTTPTSGPRPPGPSGPPPASSGGPGAGVGASGQQSAGPSAQPSAAQSSSAASSAQEPPVDVPTEGGESTQVRFADQQTADQPGAAAVRDLLQQHFNAINTHDYAGWAETVTSEQPEKIDESRWWDEYSSTVDTEIVIEEVHDEPRQVVFSLRSRQDPEKSFDGTSSCTDWRLTWPLIDEGSGLRVGVAAAGSAQPRDCDA